MITDKDVEELFEEFKEWRKDRKRPKYDLVVPSQTAYSYQYSVTIPNITIPNQPSEETEYIKRLLHKIEAIAGTLIECNALNLGLSLKADVEELKEMLITRSE